MKEFFSATACHYTRAHFSDGSRHLPSVSTSSQLSLMTGSNKKADRGDHIDRISNLPSNVIDGILKHLNILELARTSILSRKWRCMWISVPQLEFRLSFFYKCKHLEDAEISRIISGTLLLHNRPVYKFTLHFPFISPIRIESLQNWIRFLSRNGIKELELVNLGMVPDQMPYHVSSCPELTNFKLFGFNLSVPHDFCGFKSLLELHLAGNRFESGTLDSLISGCPLLEKLTISCCYGFDCIDFSTPALQVLRIDGSECMKSICLRKAKNLVDLTLMACYGYNRERGKVFDFIKGVPNIKRLVMGSGYNKALSAGTIPHMLRMSFSSLEYLKLDVVDLDERGEFLHTVSLLKSAPNLVELVIKSTVYVGTREPDELEELECDGCCLGQLLNVNITVGTCFKYAMSLIRFILANSSLLERLTFDVGLGSKKSDAPMLLSISRDLLWMERASQRAQVEFTHK